MTNRYNPAVLSGNWIEDRSKAPPLHGGIADYGLVSISNRYHRRGLFIEKERRVNVPVQRVAFPLAGLPIIYREYKPQYQDDYLPPDPSKKYTFNRHRHRFGMICNETIDEAAYSYGDGQDGRPMFETVGGRDLTPKEIASLFRTQNTDSMAEASHISAAASKTAAKDLRTLQHSEFAPPAGGAGAVKLDRGKHVVGMAGGKLNLGDDPRQNTMAQGSWMYGPHPSVKYMLNPPQPRPEVTDLSLPGLGGDGDKVNIPRASPTAPHGRYAAFAAQSRTTTDVTATQSDMNRRSGRRVFADDP